MTLCLKFRPGKLDLFSHQLCLRPAASTVDSFLGNDTPTFNGYSTVGFPNVYI